MSALSRPAGDLPELSELLQQASLLPDLPDFEVILSAAHRRLDHYQAIAEAAEAEVNRSRRFIAVLEGDAPRSRMRRPGPRTVPGHTVLRVLVALANHSYAGVSTLAQDTGLHSTTIGSAMRLAVISGYAERTNPDATRNFRWKATESGLEFITAPRG